MAETIVPVVPGEDGEGHDAPPPPGPWGPRHSARRPRRTSSRPCACCYYTLSSTDPATGLFTTGWRLFGGHWSWWHCDAPHGLVDWHQPSLGCNNPDVPACDCCYYNFMEGVPPGPGWYVGNWSHQHGSYTWMWCGDGAPHAPGPDWSLVEDTAIFMQWYTLAADGTYVPRQQAPAAAPEAVPEDAPAADPVTTTVPGGMDALEEAQEQAAILDSILNHEPEPM